MSPYFADFDFSTFWENDDYAREEYIGRNVTPEMLRAVEKALPYTLPPAYLEFLSHQNGGTPRLTAQSQGIHRVWVNGVATVVDGKATGATPGTIIKSGRDTETVAAR